jgi:hypothetical protein
LGGGWARGGVGTFAVGVQQPAPDAGGKDLAVGRAGGSGGAWPSSWGRQHRTSAAAWASEGPGAAAGP